MMEPKILFVCVENAGRSQMAEAFFHKYAPNNFQAISAGTKPRSEINPIVVEAMKEVGINMQNKKPKPLTQDLLENTIPVNMGCIDKQACPALFLQKILEWNIPDPNGRSLDEVRRIRDMIETKVRELVLQLENERK